MKNTQGGIDLANKCSLSLRLQFIEAAEISIVLLPPIFLEILPSAMSVGRGQIRFHKVIVQASSKISGCHAK